MLEIIKIKKNLSIILNILWIFYYKISPVTVSASNPSKKYSAYSGVLFGGKNTD